MFVWLFEEFGSLESARLNGGFGTLNFKGHFREFGILNFARHFGRLESLKHAGFRGIWNFKLCMLFWGF